MEISTPDLKTVLTMARLNISQGFSCHSYLLRALAEGDANACIRYRTSEVRDHRAASQICLRQKRRIPEVRRRCRGLYSKVLMIRVSSRWGLGWTGLECLQYFRGRHGVPYDHLRCSVFGVRASVFVGEAAMPGAVNVWVTASRSSVHRKRNTNHSAFIAVKGRLVRQIADLGRFRRSLRQELRRPPIPLPGTS